MLVTEIHISIEHEKIYEKNVGLGIGGAHPSICPTITDENPFQNIVCKPMAILSPSQSAKGRQSWIYSGHGLSQWDTQNDSWTFVL